jgi:hypothetical protein
MDLDDFEENAIAIQFQVSEGEVLPSKEALSLLDARWYNIVGRSGRRMDLVGDYAGTEPFVVDGMSKSYVSYMWYSL